MQIVDLKFSQEFCQKSLDCWNPDSIILKIKKNAEAGGKAVCCVCCIPGSSYRSAQNEVWAWALSAPLQGSAALGSCAPISTSMYIGIWRRCVLAP